MKRKIILVVIGIFGMGLAASFAGAGDVDLSPADSGKLVEAVAKAKAGDVIRLAAGEYKLNQPLKLVAKGSEGQAIKLEAAGSGRVVLDFTDEPEEKTAYGMEVAGDYWQITGIEVAHAGSFGIYISGNHNLLERCVSRENRDTGTQIGPPASYNLISDCESFRNFDPKTLGENADGFAAKHEVGPGNVFRGCRSYQNADDGWDLWMCPNPVLIEDCVSFHNGYNIWHIPDFQGDGNGFKFGGNYVDTPHVARRCVSIENPLHGFDQNHNLGGITLEDCVAIRCGQGFVLPEVPRKGQDVLRRDTSFACQNVLERHALMEDDHWYPDVATGNLGPPPRPGHREVPGAGAVPTTEETPLVVPEGVGKSQER
ncbi:MAG TPA: right-handed parallel beta-helix repeat-containing protein [Tepidisphaeraceae bacterium]|nr:right-handed parallel beta-helix repeat-containing protein [Tepidisphaeraceae bacterium]